MTEKDIYEATESEMSPSSVPEETVPTDKTSSGEDSESREPVGNNDFPERVPLYPGTL